MVICFHVFNFCQNCIYNYVEEIFILLYLSLNNVAVDALDIWFNTAGVLRQRICFAASFVKDANWRWGWQACCESWGDIEKPEEENETHVTTCNKSLSATYPTMMSHDFHIPNHCQQDTQQWWVMTSTFQIIVSKIAADKKSDDESWLPHLETQEGHIHNL